jgi:hypothetical protein
MCANRQNENFQVIEHTGQGVLKTPGLWLFTDEQDWQETWAEFERNGELIVVPPPSAPAVNWKQEAVILAAAGEFTTSPSEIRITSFKIHRTAAVLELAITPPGQLQALCAPSILVRFQRRSVKSASGIFRFE